MLNFVRVNSKINIKGLSVTYIWNWGVDRACFDSSESGYNQGDNLRWKNIISPFNQYVYFICIKGLMPVDLPCTITNTKGRVSSCLTNWSSWY